MSTPGDRKVTQPMNYTLVLFNRLFGTEEATTTSALADEEEAIRKFR